MDIQTIKENISANKNYFIITGVIIVVLAIGWNVYTNGNVSTDGITTQSVRSELITVGTEQSKAGTAITESKRITAEIGQTNTAIKQSIDDSRAINSASTNPIKDSQRILQQVRSSQQIKN